MAKYYSLEKILSAKDAKKQPPGVYICMGNRTAGKSFAWKLFRFKRFLKTREQTIYLVRNKGDIRTFANALMNDLIQIKYPNKEVKVTVQGADLYATIEVDGELFAYVLSLFKAGSYKPISSGFVNVGWIIFDEFQPEDGRYMTDEIEKLLNIHISVARGEGEQSRYVPITLISNTVSEINPYFKMLGITGKMQKNTRFMRGDGWVLELTINENAKDAILANPVTRAFSSAEQVEYSAMGRFLDNLDFVSDPPKNKKYQLAIISGGTTCGIWTTPDGMIYCLKAYDLSNKKIFTRDDADRTLAIFQKEVPDLVKFFISAYNRGYVRFQNIETKQVFLDFVNII